MWRGGLRLSAGLMVAVLGGGTPNPAGAASAPRVKITHGKFTPAEVRIAPGDTVTWVNDDHDVHTVTADDGSFDSHPDCREDAPEECLAEGGTWSRMFAEPGRYPYHSKTEGQKGVVLVTQS
ncbi:MAG TPA: plastocyanin/azurin family copper-binding protein [Acidimicrobiia bacterium]|nr:plastocyanin/azurin family copper-binding protein [Acidimicrobiia bacterium]